MVAGARARRAAQGGAQRRRRRAGVASSAREAGVVDLAGEVLEEAVELVEVAVGDGQERGRVGLAAGARARSRARRPAARRGSARRGRATRTRSPRSKRPARHVGVAEHARRDRAGAVAQLEREVRRARARDQPVLAGAGEDAVDLVAGAQRGDRGRRVGGGEVTRPMMYRDPDAAADLGAAGPTASGPRRSSARSRAGTTPATPPRRRCSSSARRSAPRASRRSTPRSSSTSRRRGRQVTLVDGRHARDRVARGRDLRGAHPARPARPRPAPGPRAVDALAHVLAS